MGNISEVPWANHPLTGRGGSSPSLCPVRASRAHSGGQATPPHWHQTPSCLPFSRATSASSKAEAMRQATRETCPQRNNMVNPAALPCRGCRHHEERVDGQERACCNLVVNIARTLVARMHSLLGQDIVSRRYPCTMGPVPFLLSSGPLNSLPRRIIPAPREAISPETA